MEKKDGKKPNMALRMHALRLAAVFLALMAAVSALPAGAWFYSGRSAAVAADIENATKLFIKGPEGEDIKYINLGGIDKNADAFYAVFCVVGRQVDSYKIQLGFTTNNQFRYELIHAANTGSGTPQLIYTTHSESPRTVSYYQDGDPIQGTYLNKKSNWLAYANATETPEGSRSLHEQTYATAYNSNGEPISWYDNVNGYAEPIYWHSELITAGSHDPNDYFYDYYIIKVTWDTETNGPNVNKKETDIIYISAKVF